MIKLHQFKPAFGLPNASPFCLKVETYLRMTSLPYETVTVNDPRKAPKGKLPVIEDGDRRVADSGFIVEYLKKTYGDPLDEGRSAEERAAHHVLRRTFEESLYFPLLWSRWVDERGWAVTGPAFFAFMPPVVRSIVPRMIREKVIKQVDLQGTGRHAPEEIHALAAADLSAASTILGDRPWFGGDRPGSIDATTYGFLAQVCFAPVENPLKAHAKTLANLSAYADRVKQRYWA